MTVSSPEEAHLQVWKDQGCNTTFENADVIQTSDMVLWAVKPQYFQAALNDTKLPSSDKNRFHVSVMAGVPLDKFSGLIGTHFNSPSVRAARVMPNIAMRVGSGVSGVYFDL